MIPTQSHFAHFFGEMWFHVINVVSAHFAHKLGCLMGTLLVSSHFVEGVVLVLGDMAVYQCCQQDLFQAEDHDEDSVVQNQDQDILFDNR